jgi:type I restriction enzyme, S subunit
MGLEASVVKFSDVVTRTSTKRIDPEYFQLEHLLDDKTVERQKGNFQSFADLGVRVDASAFYPSIEEHYGEGELPFLRVSDVDEVIDFKACETIPEYLCEIYPTLSKVKEGDLVFTKGGSVARIGYVTKEAAVSRDLIFVNTSKLRRTLSKYIYTYSRTNFFRRMLIRSSSQTAQPHLTITLVRELPNFIASPKFEQLVAETIDKAFIARNSSIHANDDANAKLLTALGLADWKPPSPMGYLASSSEVLAAGRLDAQYFNPKYDEVHARLKSVGGDLLLSDALAFNSRGRQPQYADSGLQVVNSKHVRTNRVILDVENRFGIEAGSPVIIQQGDVLLNGTGVGTIGRAAPYVYEAKALPDNHVTVLRPHTIDPIYLSVFLNSQLGQLQIERFISGSSGQIELYPSDIAKIIVWDAPKKVQMEVRGAILSAFDQECSARELLDRAKRAVEIAIEENEAAALRYLEEAGG